MDGCSHVWATKKALGSSSISCCLASLLKSMPRVGRCVLSTRRDRRRDRLIILWTPPAQSKYSLEVCRRVRYLRYRLSFLQSFFFSRTNCTCVPTQRSKRFTSISVSRYCIFPLDLYKFTCCYYPTGRTVIRISHRFDSAYLL
jgi:hypothetical protein